MSVCKSSSKEKWVLVFITIICIFDTCVCRIDVCPKTWELVYTDGDGVTAACLKYFNTTSTWSKASRICRNQNGQIYSLSQQIYKDLYRYPFPKIVEFWYGLHVYEGALLTDGFPPEAPNRNPFESSFPWEGPYDEEKCTVFLDNMEYLEFRFKPCRDETTFYCSSEPIDLNFNEFLSICPTGFYGTLDLPQCYKNVNELVTQQEAKSYCKRNGGALAKFNLTDDIDYVIAESIFYNTRMFFNQKVWFTNVETSECSLIYLRNSSLVTEIDPTCLTKHPHLCEVNSKQSNMSEIKVKAKFLPDQFSGYNIECNLSRPLTSVEAIRIYKDIHQIPEFMYIRNDWNTLFSINIMPGIKSENRLELTTVVDDIGVYRCEIYSKRAGLVAVDSVFTKIPLDTVIMYRGSVNFKPAIDPAMYVPFNFGYQLEYDSNSPSLQSRLSSLFSSTQSIINRDWKNNTFILKSNLTKISDDGGKAEFKLFAIPNSDNQITFMDEAALKNDILGIFSALLVPRKRRKRQSVSSISFIPGSTKLFSTVSCSGEVYIQELDLFISFSPTKVGEVVYSRELCITDLQPLVSTTCNGGDGTQTYFGNIEVNPKCLFDFIPDLENDGTTALGNLSKVGVNDTNAKDVVAQTANLTSDVANLTASDIIYTGIILDNIAHLEDVAESTVDDTVQIVSNILDVPQENLAMAQEYGSAANRILESLERIASRVMLTTPSFQRINRKLAVDVRDILATKEDVVIGFKLDSGNSGVISNETLRTFGSQTKVSNGEIDAAIILPEAVVRGNNNTRLVLQIYADTNLFKTRKQDRKYIVDGKVAAATILVNGKPIVELGNNRVKTIFLPSKTSQGYVCGFWNYSLYENSGGWATAGCMLKTLENERYICECDHLTNFAILVDIAGQGKKIDSGNTLALTVISIIGLSLSLLCLGLTILSFVLFKNMRKGRGQQTLFNLAVAMTCYIVVFLAGSDQTTNYGGCIAVSVLLHYFILAAFMWMLVEGILQYLRFVKVLGTYIPNFIWKAALPAWGIPIIPVVIMLAVNYDSYKGGNSYCWMDRTPFYFAFLLPVCLILSANCIVFALVLKHILKSPKGLQSNQTPRKRAMMNLRAGIAVLVLLGLTWIFGFLAIEGARLIFLYIFTILNVFQGFFIFILFVAREKQFAKNWRTLCCKKKPKSKYVANSSSDSKSNPATALNPYYSKSTSVTNVDSNGKDVNDN